MLKYLGLSEVGPAPRMEIHLCPRLNILTANRNGLGKSLILDMAWWAMTGTWSGIPAHPSGHENSIPSIRCEHGNQSFTSTFDRQHYLWQKPAAPTSRIVIYAQENDIYSIWDPRQHPSPFLYSADEFWKGRVPHHRKSEELPCLLTWVWAEHQKASTAQEKVPSSEIIYLIDDIDDHLHPEIQRDVLPAILEAIGTLGEDLDIQLVTSTHAPMVMASAEPYFDEKQDGFYHFALNNGAVTLEKVPWEMQGDASNWLISSAFGLSSSRSKEAEQAIKAVEAWQRNDFQALPPHLNTKAKICAELARVIPGDEFLFPEWRGRWPRNIRYLE